MASRRSQRGLDALNFFVADVQTGFGPFVAVYLTSQAWTEVEIGFALSLGTLTAMLSQVPAGALVDALRQKRRAALAALLAIALSAVLLAGFPSTLPVLVAEVLHGFASCILTPSIAAISLALVGRAALGERLGRNARYAALGGAIAAGVMGLVGTYVSPAAVFWLTAGLTIPAMACLAMIRPGELHPPAPDPQRSARQSGLLQLLRNRGILIFAACCVLFTLSNAAMLPMAAAAVTRSVGDEASLIIAACLVVPQLVVAGISPWVGRMAEQHGRRLVLGAGFLALPLRGLLLALVDHPWALILVQALDGLSAATLGVMLPLLAADLTCGTNRFNLCMGLFGLAVGIGGTLSTSLAGLVATWAGGSTAFAMLGGIGLCCAALAFLAMPETKAPPGAPLPRGLPAR